MNHVNMEVAMLPQRVSDNQADESRQFIKCCDCEFAKQYREVNQATGRYVLKVRCSKGHWKRGRKHGDCDLHRVLARRSAKCRDYVSMSESEEERKQYLLTLAETLPLERIVYETGGEPADFE
jgi:hypothetical protein